MRALRDTYTYAVNQTNIQHTDKICCKHILIFIFVFWSLWRPLSGCFTRILMKFNSCSSFMSQICRWISVYDKACFASVPLLVCFINVSRFNPCTAKCYCSVLLRGYTLSIMIILCSPAFVTCVTKVPLDFRERERERDGAPLIAPAPGLPISS